MTKVALIGYGKMGKLIHEMSSDYACEIVSIIDPMHPEAHRSINIDSISAAQIALKFTHPGIVMQNIKSACDLGLSIVVGTTGWFDRLDEVREMVNSAGIGLLYGANFSIGMNLFLRVVENAAQEYGRFAEYDVYGYELHHRQKADSPSGTAISLADRLLKNSPLKAKANFDRLERKISSDELHFASIRAGAIPGTHTVGFDSEADTIELTHRARNRSGFAMGALQAANWMLNKKGVYSINDMIEELLC